MILTKKYEMIYFMDIASGFIKLFKNQMKCFQQRDFSFSSLALARVFNYRRLCKRVVGCRMLIHACAGYVRFLVSLKVCADPTLT